MDNFFKSIKDNLENRATPDFNPAAWESMKSKMTSAQTTPVAEKPLNKWLPLLLFLLIGSSALNTWLLLNSNNTNLNSNKNSIVQQIDTIFQTNVIYKTDTIFETKYITIHPAIHLAQNNHTTAENNSISNVSEQNREAALHTLIDFQKFLDYQIASFDKNSFTTLSGLPLNSLKKELEGEPAENSIAKNDKFVLTTFDQLSTQPISAINAPLQSTGLNYSNANAAVYKKSFNEMIYPMLPKSFKIGISAGIVTPFDKDIEAETKFMYGIEPSVVFNENFELYGALSNFDSEFEKDEMNEAFGIPFFEYEDDDAEFEQAIVSQNILLYGLGMKYFFPIKEKFRPYVGVGFYGARISDYSVKYEFELDDNNTGGGDNEDEDIQIKRLYDGFNSNNQWVLRSGLEYRFLNNWSVQLDGFYNFVIQGEQQYTPDKFGLRTGIFRKF